MVPRVALPEAQLREKRAQQAEEEEEAATAGRTGREIATPSSAARATEPTRAMLLGNNNSNNNNSKRRQFPYNPGSVTKRKDTCHMAGEVRPSEKRVGSGLTLGRGVKQVALGSRQAQDQAPKSWTVRRP